MALPAKSCPEPGLSQLWGKQSPFSGLEMKSMILVKVGTPQTELGVSARGRKAPQEPGEGKRSGSRSQGWICWSLAGALQSQPFPCPLGPGCPCSSPAPGFPADSPGRCSRASPCGAGAGAGAGQRIPGRAGAGSSWAGLAPGPREPG